METESAALCRIVTDELLSRPFSLAVDCHSGFGMRDRIWFPHAHTPRPIEHLAEIHALLETMDDSLLHHRYRVEPQSRQYLAHGDLWDHLYLQTPPGAAFIPLTLEMGSWLWVRKNPRQLFSRHGLFNPTIAHRQQRVLRAPPHLAGIHRPRRLQPCALASHGRRAGAPASAGPGPVVHRGPRLTTWILLRGLTRERGHWGDFPAMLVRALPDATVGGNGPAGQRPS